MKPKQFLIGGTVVLGLAIIGAIATSLNRDNAVRVITPDYNACYVGQAYIVTKEKFKGNLDIFKNPSDRAEAEESIKKGESTEQSCERYYQFTKTWGSNLFEDPVERSKKNKLNPSKP